MLKINRKNLIKYFLSGLTVIALVTAGFFAFNNPKESKAGWWNESWSYRKALTINGSKIAGNLTNFPILVSLTDSDLAAGAQEDGDDIIFVSVSGEKLKHEIEKYASTTGELVAWVKMPELASSTDTYLYMYYGNAGADSQQDKTNVWSDGLTAVWHMSANSPDDDSTSDPINLTANGGASSVAGGKIDGGYQIDGLSEYLETTLSNHIAPAGEFSFWYKETADCAGYNSFFSAAGSYWDEFIYYRNNSDTSVPFAIESDHAIFTTNLFDGNWYYITLGWDDAADERKLFINGLQSDATDTDSFSLPSISSFYIGNDYDGFNQPINGIVDEFRISNTEHGLDWHKTEYNNQSDPAGFLTPQSQETGPGPVGYWSFDEGYGATAHDSTTNKNDGTITSATWQDESNCVAGKCLYFDGTDTSRARVDANVNNNMSVFTACAWFKVNSLINPDSEEYMVILQKGWYISVSNSGKLEFSVPTSSAWPVVNSKKNIETNKWYQVCGVFDGVESQPKIYLNGLDDSYNSSSGNGTQSDNSNRTLRFGAVDLNEWGYNYYGFIDEVKIYPYARTADQIKQDYAAGLAGQSTAHGAAAAFGSASNKWMSDGLVGYWPMDESATTSGASDLSGNGNTGTYTGNASTTGGKFGNGGVFDGNSDYVRINNYANTFLDFSHGSISFWYKSYFTSMSGYPRLISYEQNGDMLSCAFLDTVTMQCTHGSDYGTIYNIQKAIPSVNTDRLWHNVVFSWDINGQGRNLALAIDGEETFNDSAIVNATLANNYFYIGSESTNGYWFNGQIDEVRIYNRALSAGEVRKLYEWAPGPVIHWQIDEAAGETIYDTSGNGLHTYFYGSPNPVWTYGKKGNALSFSSGGYLRRGDSILFRPSVGFTAQAWIKREGAFGTGSTVAIATSFESGGADWLWWLGFGESNKLCFMMNPGDLNHDDRYYMYGSEITDQNWHHVAEVYDGTAMKLYIDGLLDTYYATTSLIATASSSLTVGANDGGDVPFIGKIDDVRIYNYARTQKQILEDMNGSVETRYSASLHPVLRLNFDEGYGATAHDSTIYGNNGTLNPGTGGTNTATSAMWTLDGKFGKAVEFDGADDYADISSIPVNTNNGEANTVTFWMKWNGNGGGIPFSWAPYYSLYIAYNCFGFNDAEDNVFGFSTQGLANNYVHVTAIFYNNISITNNNKIYINGEEKTLRDCNDPTTGDAPADGNITIGRLNDVAAYYFGGNIDDLKIYPYALNEDEIKQDYNSGFSAVMGQTGRSNSTATSSGSASLEYCVPGSTDYCAAPVGEWKFDEMTGNTAYDTSGNGNDGTLGAGTAAYRPAWSNLGKFGNALNFDGTDDYVHLTALPTLSAPYTLSFWLYPKEMKTGEVKSLINLGNTGFPNFLFSDTDKLFVYAGSEKYRYGTKIFTAADENKWWHAVFVVADGNDLSNWKVYLNGVDDTGNAGANSGTYYNPSAPGYIGENQGWPWNSLKGIIDNVRIYNYARTPAQIAYEYNRGKPIASWKFDECSGGTIHDSSGNGNTGTLNLGTSGTTATGTCASSSNSFWYNGRTGKKNSSGSFDGTDDYVNIPYVSMLNLAEPASYSVWIKTTNDSTEQFIFSISKASGDYETTGIVIGDYFYDMQNELFCFEGLYGVACYTTNNRNELFDGNWHQIICTGDGSSYKLYLDGKEKPLTMNGTNDGSIGPVSDADTIRIGNLRSNSNNIGIYNGKIDEVKIWNYALTAEQVQQDYAGGAVRFGN